jgi:hypothetical protein
MSTIDLDAVRAARREAEAQAPSVKLGGKVFELPVELPFGVFLLLPELRNEDTSVAAVSAVVRELFGEKHDEFMALGPSMEDLEALLNGVMEEYGLNPGESEASPDS